MAILHANNPSAWQAVYDYFGKSEEAVLARLQLALMSLRKGQSGVKDADGYFQELYGRAMENLDDRRDLAFFALLGQVKCAQLSGDQQKADELILNRLTVEFSEEIENLPAEDVPAELQGVQRSLQGFVNPAASFGGVTDQ